MPTTPVPGGNQIRTCGMALLRERVLLVITRLEVGAETSDSNILGRRSRLLNRPLLA
jgi:hypothetical protein